MIVAYVDAWTSLGGSQFLDSPGHRPLPLVPVRRDRAVRRRELPHAGRTPPPGDQRQVQRRLRRDDHADAAAGRVRRAGHPRRRRALRGLLPAGVRQGRRGSCATPTAARTASLPGRLPRPRSSGPSRPTSPLHRDVRLRRGATPPTRTAPCGCPSTTPASVIPEVWERWLARDPVLMAAEPAYAEALRSLDCDLDRRGHHGRVLPRLRRGRVPARGGGRGGARRRGPLRAVRRRATAPSSTAIRSPSPGSPSASRP